MCGCNERFPTTVESKQSKMAGCRGFGNREYYWGELAQRNLIGLAPG